jgi:hypothetical protein
MMSVPGPIGAAGPSADRIARAAVTHAALTARPVLLMHIFTGTNACWFALTRALCAHGGTVGAINYLLFGVSPWRAAA